MKTQSSTIISTHMKKKVADDKFQKPFNQTIQFDINLFALQFRTKIVSFGQGFIWPSERMMGLAKCAINKLAYCIVNFAKKNDKIL